MNVRRMTLLAAAGALLASRAAAQADAQQPPSQKQRSWYQKDEQKARELGQKGASGAKKGASKTGEAVNSAGQWANAKVVGTKTVTGKIADVSQDQVTVRPPNGQPMNMRVTKSTKVTVGGKKQPVGALQQGDEVRASYAESGGAATATKIDVKRTPGSTPGSSGTGSSAGSSGSGSPSR